MRSVAAARMRSVAAAHTGFVAEVIVARTGSAVVAAAAAGRVGFAVAVVAVHIDLLAAAVVVVVQTAAVAADGQTGLPAVAAAVVVAVAAARTDSVLATRTGFVAGSAFDSVRIGFGAAASSVRAGFVAGSAATRIDSILCLAAVHTVLVAGFVPAVQTDFLAGLDFVTAADHTAEVAAVHKVASFALALRSVSFPLVRRPCVHLVRWKQEALPQWQRRRAPCFGNQRNCRWVRCLLAAVDSEWSPEVTGPFPVGHTAAVAAAPLMAGIVENPRKPVEARPREPKPRCWPAWQFVHCTCPQARSWN
mmetsp:Transcript_20668/g.47413  ORF Transcript_20668/g.47413 Transcript_20668/m.47413 type:complete len:306 (-) Transcript_20668:6075-6992(-)